MSALLAPCDLLDFDPEDVTSLPYLGRGVERETFALSSAHVVKVARSLYAGCQNEEEVSNWLRFERTKFAPYLAPCVAWADDRSWIIAERCEPIRRSEWQSLEVAELRRIALLGMGLADLHPSNIGRTSSGRLVLIDYAA